jgi:hypothetical protein
MSMFQWSVTGYINHTSRQALCSEVVGQHERESVWSGVCVCVCVCVCVIFCLFNCSMLIEFILFCFLRARKKDKVGW